MSIKINTIEDLNNNLYLLPTEVVEDINKRITNWLSAGGTLEDNYIKQQFRFAENFIKLRS